MGHIDDETAKAIADEVKPLVKELPADLRREAREHLKVLEEIGELDPGHVPETSKTEQWRTERDKRAAWLEATIDEWNEHQESVPFDPGPVKSVTMPSGPDADGDWWRTTHYQAGYDEKELLDRDAMNAAAAEIARIGDEVEAIKDLDAQALNSSRLAGDAEDAGLSGQADSLRGEADKLRSEARDRREALRQEFIDAGTPEEIGVWKLGSYEPPLEGVQEALDSLHDGRTADVYEMLRGFDQAAMYQFMNRVPPEDQGFVEKLLEIESGEREARAAAGGWS
jgi:hypothetical protein